MGRYAYAGINRKKREKGVRNLTPSFVVVLFGSLRISSYSAEDVICLMIRGALYINQTIEDEIGLMRFGCGSIPSENELIGVSPTISSAAW